MTEHTHTTLVPGCYRCELNRDEIRGQFEDMREEVYEINLANGWFERDRTFDDGIALIHTEIAEMMEAYRSWQLDDVTGKVSEDKDLVDPQTNEVVHKPEGVGSEAADILVRLLDEAKRQEIDLMPQIRNWSGNDNILFTAVVNRLHRYVAQWHDAVETETLKKGTVLRSHAMNNGWWRVYNYLARYCELLNIDLMWEYERKIAYNRLRGYRHGGNYVV